MHEIMLRQDVTDPQFRTSFAQRFPARQVLTNRVPAAVAARLAGFQSADTSAQLVDLLQKAGLKILEVDETSEAFLFKIALPEAVISEQNGSYYCPQIKFPRFAGADVPFGTVLLNCLIPPVETLESAERIFNAYMDIMDKLSGALGACPSACYTGIKEMGSESKNDLYSRGFRFFFSPQPEKLMAAVDYILTLCAQDRPATQAERRALYNQRLKARCQVDEKGRLRSHPVLEDVSPLLDGRLILLAA